jgi:putative acetyltransferase
MGPDRVGNIKSMSERERKAPDVADPSLVGTYPARVGAGGGYVWDAVLEYRVWCHPQRGAPDEDDGNDYFHVFADYDEAVAFSQHTRGAEEPLALVLQDEYLEEPRPGEYIHRRSVAQRAVCRSLKTG